MYILSTRLAYVKMSQSHRSLDKYSMQPQAGPAYPHYSEDDGRSTVQKDSSDPSGSEVQANHDLESMYYLPRRAA